MPQILLLFMVHTLMESFVRLGVGTFFTFLCSYVVIVFYTKFKIFRNIVINYSSLFSFSCALNFQERKKDFNLSQSYFVSSTFDKTKSLESLQTTRQIEPVCCKKRQKKFQPRNWKYHWSGLFCPSDHAACIWLHKNTFDQKGIFLLASSKRLLLSKINKWPFSSILNNLLGELIKELSLRNWEKKRMVDCHMLYWLHLL